MAGSTPQTSDRPVGGTAMSDSSAEHSTPRGRHHQALDDPALRLVKWTIVLAIATIVLAVASWVANGITWYSVKAQREDGRELLQTQIAVELDKEFDSAEMRRARRSLASELLAKKGGDVSDYRVFDFFEKVASYHDDERIDDETLYDAFSHYAVRYWLVSQDIVKRFRKEEGDDAYYAGFEDLSDWMLSYEAEYRAKKVAEITPSASQIESFLRDEAALAD
jgi:hypothetical protein